MYGGCINAVEVVTNESEAIGYSGEYGAKPGNTVNIYGGEVYGNVNISFIPNYSCDIAIDGTVISE